MDAMASTRDDVVALIESFYQARLANDVDRCVAHFAPDASIRIAGSHDASPIAASSSGPMALRRQTIELVGAWQWLSMRIESMTVEGDRVAVQFQLTTKFRPTGDVISSELLDLFTVRDGKVASMVEFLDTALVALLVAKTTR
jgi:ketosteroid isomerase-like protein